jgi:hypothetical protein
MTHRILTLVAALLLSTLVTPVASPAGERFLIPEERLGPPAYMRLETADETGFTDQVWVAIPVYRYEDDDDSGGIPPDFNLLEFLDNATPERAAYARTIDLQVQGFVVRNPQPLVFYFEDIPGKGVPVLFVTWDEFQAETDDGEIFIDELLAMKSLQVGMADFYMEELYIGWTHRIVTSGVVVEGTLAGMEFFATYAHGAATQVPKIVANITFAE